MSVATRELGCAAHDKRHPSPSERRVADLVFVLGNSPQSTASRVVSVLPPLAPLLMPLRIATGAASVLEIVVAATLLVAATAGMLRLAGAV